MSQNYFFQLKYKKKRYNIVVPINSTLLTLKQAIYSKTKVEPEKQKIFGLTDTLDSLKDDTYLTTLNLSSHTKRKNKKKITFVVSYFGNVQVEKIEKNLKRIENLVRKYVDERNICEDKEKGNVIFEEKLTGLLLQLDGIECEGNMREKRRNVINLIQQFQTKK